ncbi:hypothetical protein C8J57DRAFT_1246122 [Mycena rebaudengoi]|nr:hypothetical protein C8J57DRAFT_1246122 [Mycena rebaudengoi]
MSVHNHTVDIDAATRLPKVDVAKKTSSKWEPWAPRLYDEHDIRPAGTPLSVEDIFIDGVVARLAYRKTTRLAIYIEDRLELRERNLTDVALHELENTMGSMTAALYWGAQHGRYQPELSVVSTWWLVSISLILLFLSYLMTFRQSGSKRPMDRSNLGTPAPKRSPINTIGILQSFWLSQGSIPSELLQRVSNVDDPSVENLRRAGMFMVQLDGQPRSSRTDSEISLLSMPTHIPNSFGYPKEPHM